VSARPQTSSPALNRILIVRLGSMGDVIHTLPAATALRQAFPEATLGWVIEERWTELLCTLPAPRSGPRSPQRPLVDKIHTVDTQIWRHRLLHVQTWERIASSLSDLRAPNYEIAIDFQGAIRSALLARWSGAPVIYGFAQPCENIASMFYTRKVIARGTHIVEQNLSLAEVIARTPLNSPEVQFPHDPAAERGRASNLSADLARNIVVLNPGAGWGAKQWPAERYGEVAKKLAEEGFSSFTNFGSGEEELAKKVELASNGAARPFSGSLTQLIALTRRARLFIGGDTGPLHLAAALRVPVLAIFGPTDPARNGPFGTCSIVLRNPASATSHKRRSRPDEGLLKITSQQVVEAARQLLRSCRA
jgi:lipopolysaccharide heptosyltransferase I